MSDYIEQSDIEDVFGTANIARWSNLDNLTTAVNATRVAKAIAYAGGFVEDQFRGSDYAVPFVGTLPAQMEGWMARLAGIWLYQNRGTTDEGPEDRMTSMKQDVLDEISTCLRGSFRLNLGINQTDSPTAPVIV